MWCVRTERFFHQATRAKSRAKKDQGRTYELQGNSERKRSDLGTNYTLVRIDNFLKSEGFNSVYRLCTQDGIIEAMPSLQQYFAYWSQSQLIREYISTAYGVRSLELNIPADWRALFLPGQEQRGVGNTPNALPSVLIHAITKLGFIASEHYAGIQGVGARRYILREHRFPISVLSYRFTILPNLSMRHQDFRPKDSQLFNNTLDNANHLHLQELERALQAPDNPGEWVDLINQGYADT